MKKYLIIPFLLFGCICVSCNNKSIIDGDNENNNTSIDSKYFPVQFLNYDLTLLYKVYVQYGNDAVYKGATPFKKSSYYENYKIDYIFSGWDKDTTNITNSTLFVAQFKEVITNLSENEDIKNQEEEKYESLLSTLKKLAKDSNNIDSNRYSLMFNYSIESGYSYTSMIEVGVDSNILNFYFSQTSIDFSTGSSVTLFIPDNYQAKCHLVYKNKLKNNNSIENGEGDIEKENFNKDYLVSFESYSGATSQYVSEYLAKSLLLQYFDKFNLYFDYDLKDLGFINL